jgi:thiol-disulfide isomerase/thioredoxin
VRSDKSLEKSFVQARDWDSYQGPGVSKNGLNPYKLPNEQKAKLSLSGSERNHLFVKDHNGVFVDVSGNSGLDSVDDGRSIAVFDFDRDGQQDFLLANANGKTLNLFRNQIGDMSKNHHFVAIRMVGGNKNAHASTEFSNRDGIGARVSVSVGTNQQLRELHCGEGLAAENSRTMVVGLGSATIANAISVEWPSGKTQLAENVASHSLVTFFEDKSETEDGSGFHVEEYRRSEIKLAEAPVIRRQFPVVDIPASSGIAVYTAMATWCSTCRSHIPDISRIKESFHGEIPVYAIPIDPEDDAKKLAEYVQEFKPDYDLLEPDIDRSQRFVQFAEEVMGSADLPFSVIVSANGTVLQVEKGLPTLSELRKALATIASPVE